MDKRFANKIKHRIVSGFVACRGYHRPLSCLFVHMLSGWMTSSVAAEPTIRVPIRLHCYSNSSVTSILKFILWFYLVHSFRIIFDTNGSNVAGWRQVLVGSRTERSVGFRCDPIAQGAARWNTFGCWEWTLSVNSVWLMKLTFLLFFQHVHILDFQ